MLDYSKKNHFGEYCVYCGYVSPGWDIEPMKQLQRPTKTDIEYCACGWRVTCDCKPVVRPLEPKLLTPESSHVQVR